MMRVRYPLYRIITLIFLIFLISVSILLKIVSVINDPVYEAVDGLKDVKLKRREATYIPSNINYLQLQQIHIMSILMELILKLAGTNLEY